MRLFLVWIVIAVGIWACTLIWFTMAPIYFGVQEKFDEDWKDIEGAEKTVWETNTAISRYLYWTIYLTIVGGLLLWGFAAAQRRDPESHGVYYR